MASAGYLRDANGNRMYPISHAYYTYTDWGTNVQDELKKIKNQAQLWVGSKDEWDEDHINVIDKTLVFMPGEGIFIYYKNENKLEALASGSGGGGNGNVTIIYQSDTSDPEGAWDTVFTRSPEEGEMIIIKTENDDIQGYCWSDVEKRWFVFSGDVDADHVLFKENITCAGDYTQVGNINKGTKADITTIESKNKTLMDVMTSIFTKELQPAIVSEPYVTISFPQAGSYEVGSTIVPNYRVELNPGSYTYGPATGIKAKKWDIVDTFNKKNTESLKEIFDNGIRYAHNNNSQHDQYKTSEMAAWYWDDTRQTMVQPQNTNNLTGFVTKKTYDNYTHTVTLKSTDGDDDVNGVVIAYMPDATGNIHTLSALCIRRGWNSSAEWLLAYDYNLPTENILFRKGSGTNGTTPGNFLIGGWNTIPNGITVCITKNGNNITAECSDWNSTELNPNTKISINLSDYSWGSIFSGKVHYGYCSLSQANSFFTNIEFAVSNYEGSFDTYTITDTSRYYIRATATYDAGAYAQTNIKNITNIRIPAGTKTATSSAITGYRAFFYGALTSPSATPLTSSIIRGLTNGGNYNASKTFNINPISGGKRYIVAIPESSSRVGLTSAILPNTMNVDQKSQYKTQTVNVEGRNGYESVSYKVYIYEPATIGVNEIHKITLG